MSETEAGTVKGEPKEGIGSGAVCLVADDGMTAFATGFELDLQEGLLALTLEHVTCVTASLPAERFLVE